MAKRLNSEGESVKVRVGDATVSNRPKGSMDMVADKSPVVDTPVAPSAENKKDKNKADFFAWFKKKDNQESSPRPEAPKVIRSEKANPPDPADSPKTNWCDRGIKVCLHLALLIIPLLFTPLTFEAFELSKQTALYILAVVAFLLWLVKIIIAKQVTLAKTLVTIPILVYLALYLASTLFSLDMFSSFFGFYGRFNGGFVEIAALVILFFVALNNVKSLTALQEYLRTFVVGYLIVAVTSLLQILGVFIWPWEFAKTPAFNLVGGSITMLSIFLAAGAGAIVVLALRENKIWKIICVVASILGVVILFLLSISIGWITLIASMIMIFAIVVTRMPQMKEKKAVAWLPLVFLALGVAFLLIPTAGLFKLNLPTELSLGRPISWDIDRATIGQKPLLGSGPETFFQDFTQYRPVQFNDTILWSMRFDKAGTQFFNSLATIGVIGTGLLALIMVLTVWEAIKQLMREKDENKWALLLAPFSAWVGLTVISFFYFFNTTLSFLWWILMAFTIAAILNLKTSESAAKEKRWSFANSPQVALITSFIFLVVLIGGIVAFYFVGKMYLADINYRSGQEKLAKGEDLEGALNDFVAAATLNKSRAVYHRGAAQTFMAQANKEAVKETPDINYVSNAVKLGIDAARTAQTVEPSNVASWEFLASIYQNAGLYVRGADEWIIDSYNKAIELDPNNPIPVVMQGKAYVIKSDHVILEAEQALKQAQEKGEADKNATISPEKTGEAEQLLNLAIEKFNRGIELKQNYFDAHLSLAQTLDKKGDRAGALKEMQIALLLAPDNIDAAYEMGRILYNDKKYDEAEKIFQRILENNDKYSNALYSMGLIYLQRNEKDKALEMFKKVLELNPGNKSIQSKIDELEGKKPTTVEQEIPKQTEPVESGRPVPTGTELDQPETPVPSATPRVTPIPTPTATATPKKANTTP